MAATEGPIAGLALRYATAIFELGSETNALDALAADFSELKVSLKDSPELARLVRSPLYSREDQAKAMRALLTQAGASPLTIKLVLLLAEKRRLFALSGIITSFEQLLAKHKGEVAAEVTSARALGQDEITALKRILKDKLGREPQLELHVDPSLLGGLKLKVGSRMIDSSIKAKLEGLRTAMKGRA